MVIQVGALCAHHRSDHDSPTERASLWERYSKSFANTTSVGATRPQRNGLSPEVPRGGRGSGISFMQANNVGADLPTSSLYSSLPPRSGLIRGLGTPLNRGNVFMMPLALTYHVLSVFKSATEAWFLLP